MKLNRIETTSVVQELIPIYTTDIGVKVVNARELYDSLELKKDFSSWIKSYLKNYKEADIEEVNAFTQKGESNFDYFKFTIPATKGRGKKIEYILTLDTAKEIAMMSRCEKGREIRRYFIEVEKTFNEMVTALSNPEQSPEEKVAEALLLAQDMLDKTKANLIKSERNKTYNKKVNVHLRRRIKELQKELDNVKENPNSSDEDIQLVLERLSKAEHDATYWEGAYACLEEKYDTKETQLMTILTVRKDGKKYFGLLAQAHAAAIPERNADKKAMRANVFRKDVIQKCSKVSYSHSFASNFIERIHPLSIPVALNAYITALENRLDDKFEEVIGEDLIAEVKQFIAESEDNLDDIISKEQEQ